MEAKEKAELRRKLERYRVLARDFPDGPRERWSANISPNWKGNCAIWN